LRAFILRVDGHFIVAPYTTGGNPTFDDFEAEIRNFHGVFRILSRRGLYF
jgi:hypothetical protein